MPKSKTPRIEIRDCDDEDSWELLIRVFLRLKGESFLLDSVDAESVDKEDWDKFMAKAEFRAKQLGIPVIMRAEAPEFN